MKFTYTYRSSDGQRHTAEIEAENRDAAFAKVRTELGIKPIKVTAEPEESRQDGGSPSQGGRRSFINAILTGKAAILAAVSLAAIGGAWWLAGARDARPYQVTTPQGTVTYTVATPLPRQAIPGNRTRIDAARETAFQSSAERLLSCFAEPGRSVPLPDGKKPSQDDFRRAMREPIRTASNDFTEIVDIKRIVTGMKREMKAYLDGGGTVEGYISELEKRQRLEISYRENAMRRVEELLNGKDGVSSSSRQRESYSYWLKANASLKSMGIYELPLPDSLRAYQTGLDIDE